MDDFSIKTSIYEGFSMAMLNNQMVTKLTLMIPKIQRFYQKISNDHGYSDRKDH